MFSFPSRNIVGWTAVGISSLFSSLWAFWGAVEAFHEGWYSRDWKINILMTLGQYASPMLLVTLPALTGVRWPRAGAALHMLLGAWAIWFFRGAAATMILAVPLLALAALYWFGRPQPRKRALALVAGLPCVVFLLSGMYPGWLALDRFDDGNYGARTIEGNGVRLTWAPEGPGWPERGTSWHDAQRNCAHLDASGLLLQPEPVNIWRLPTVDEAVRSAVRRGANAGGTWDAQSRAAHYRIQPNKDSPLWKKYSQIIYWWTATEASEESALRFVWNGQVHPARKTARWGYLSYRCVSEKM